MVELLSPGGNFISLRAALINGADSVYIGLKDNNMRTNTSNFSIEDIKKASKIAKEYSSKIYLCSNTIMRDEDILLINSYLPSIKNAEIDAMIVSDIGLADLAIENDIDVHMSVQENISNVRSLKTFKKLGVKRAILSRELNIKEIKKIANDSPIETEVFIHGAMCMAISGRCFLSYGLYNKSANCGECLQPCRKQWKLTVQDEDSDFYEKCEDSVIILDKSHDSSYKSNFLSPYDMAMIEHIPELMETGVDAFKIEGRARSPDYVATATRIYKEAIDSYESGNYKFKESWLSDLKKVYNRGFDTGFYFNPSFKTGGDNKSEYIKKDIAKVVNYYSKIKVAELQIWEDLSLGDEIIIQGKTTGSINHVIKSMEIDGKAINHCKKGNNIAIAIDEKVRENDFVYKLIKRVNNLE